MCNPPVLLYVHIQYAALQSQKAVIELLVKLRLNTPLSSDIYIFFSSFKKIDHHWVDWLLARFCITALHAW